MSAQIALTEDERGVEDGAAAVERLIDVWRTCRQPMVKLHANSLNPAHLFH